MAHIVMHIKFIQCIQYECVWATVCCQYCLSWIFHRGQTCSLVRLRGSCATLGGTFVPIAWHVWTFRFLCNRHSMHMLCSIVDDGTQIIQFWRRLATLCHQCNWNCDCLPQKRTCQQQWVSEICACFFVSFRPHGLVRVERIRTISASCAKLELQHRLLAHLLLVHQLHDYLLLQLAHFIFVYPHQINARNTDGNANQSTVVNSEQIYATKNWRISARHRICQMDDLLRAHIQKVHRWELVRLMANV